MDNIELPKCYILRLKDQPRYAPHTGFAYALYENIIKGFLERGEHQRYLTSKIDQARRWATHKKLQAALKQYPEAAKYYYVVGSDGSIIDAESLL